MSMIELNVHEQTPALFRNLAIAIAIVFLLALGVLTLSICAPELTHTNHASFDIELMGTGLAAMVAAVGTLVFAARP